MLTLEELKRDALVSGIETGIVVKVVATEAIGTDALTVVYRTPEGKIADRMIFRRDEINLSLAHIERPWAFDAPGADFKLAVAEASIDRPLGWSMWFGACISKKPSTKRKASTREAFTLFTLGRPEGYAYQRFVDDSLPNLCSSQLQS